MGTTSTQPNSTNCSTQPIGKDILSADTSMENVSLSQTYQIFKVMGCQDIHKVNIQRLLQIFIDLVEKYFTNEGMRNPCWFFLEGIIRMVRSVLQEAIHYEMTIRT